MIVLPRASIVCTPRAIVTLARGPTAAMRPSRTSTVPSSSGARVVPSMIRAPTSANEPLAMAGIGAMAVSCARAASA
jgi:hypothetical protein